MLNITHYQRNANHLPFLPPFVSLCNIRVCSDFQIQTLRDSLQDLCAVTTHSGKTHFFSAQHYLINTSIST